MNRQLYQYHPVSGYTFIPELRTRVMHEAGGYLLSSNAQGFRSRCEFQRAKGPAPRILLFGDSFTAGMGVSENRRYGDLLEERLGVDIFNFALPGTGTDQHYLIWKDLASQIDHDLVVIAVQVENIRRVNSRFRRFEDV
jgi:carbamoyltransferase